jgi:hypothetical protein
MGNVAMAILGVLVGGPVLGLLLLRGLGWWNVNHWDKEITRTDEPLELTGWRPR